VRREIYFPSDETIEEIIEEIMGERGDFNDLIREVMYDSEISLMEMRLCLKICDRYLDGFCSVQEVTSAVCRLKNWKWSSDVHKVLSREEVMQVKDVLEERLVQAERREVGKEW